MSAEGHELAYRVFQAACEAPEGERRAVLDRECSGDPSLRARVERLLRHDASGSSELDGGAIALATSSPSSGAKSGDPSIAVGSGSGSGPRLGKSIGPYRIRSVLGKGGYGVVYLADDTELDREVAVKALPSEWASDAERVERLCREARVLGRFNHPHIAQIYSLEEQEGLRFLILEYVRGESLREMLKRGPMEMGEALRICATIADAVDAAHHRGVIHRDIKPENVRITPDGVVKVLDFGLALTPAPGAERPPTMAEAVAGDSVVVSARRLVGSLGYMSPEQLRGQSVDRRTDVFAFGCVLYECLTGKRAFPGDTVWDFVRAVIDDEADLACLSAGTPARVRALIARCLSKELSERLPDLRSAAKELLESIAELNAGHVRDRPAEQTPNNLPAETSTFVGRGELLESLRGVMREARLVTLAGPGGSGKTRLGVRAARKMLSLHPQGVWSVELAGVEDPAGVAGAIAGALGLAGTGPDVHGRLVERLGEGEVLLLLDNCEHVLSGCVSTVDLLLRACPRLKVLATSQEAFGVAGEWVFAVPSLSVPGVDEPPEAAEVGQYESVRLFVERARAACPGFSLTDENAQVVARICRRLDGIPLAIELAAALVRVLSPAQIDERLHKRFELLTGGREVRLQRHRTLRAAVEWSFGLLSESEHRLMKELAVLGSGWTVDMARAACAGWLDEFEMLGLLNRLVGKSLIHVDQGHGGAGGPRYGMLDTIRHYALEQLAEGVHEGLKLGGAPSS